MEDRVIDYVRLFKDFSKSIEDRTGILTEDNVRYFFFACMLKQDPILAHYSLELPYRLMGDSGGYDGITLSKGLETAGNLELDMYYSAGNERLCIEFKFHRNPSTGVKSNTAFPHTMSAGEMFNDIQRLQHINVVDSSKSCRKLFVYVTDDEMHKYLGNPKRKSAGRFREVLRSFYSGEKTGISLPEEMDLINGNLEGTPSTFRSYAYKSIEQDTQNSTCLRFGQRLLFQSDIFCPSKSLKQVTAEATCHIRIFEIL